MSVADEWEIWFPNGYEIGSESVRSFGRATRSWHVPYAASRVVPTDTPVPNTMLGAPLMQAASALVGKVIPGCNLSAILHAGQTFHYFEPLRMGDVVSIGTRLQSHTVKAETDLIIIECGAYVGETLKLSVEIFIAHSQRDTGVDLNAADKLADEIMMTGTGPSRSDEYTANVTGA